ncbi:hypothetical protein AB23_2250 [Escherichia coli 6-319-05_S1_C1]|nr:hypothetical protein ECENVIRA101_2032 [Escherichia coli Envira 10/1]EMZ82566.1 hypothetical protein ECP03052931_3465 [Escherichia coli p0305293.1]KEM15765.1 hypothetical protein AB80_5581 [Escherichia coli 6-319-05_S1_C3]KEM19286.1 hypothetical protein AB51_5177 [Escherichia coli 6-319-05_S1_C2]KEM92296.1 hypothetical protein AB23_5226 [Escherichia coli 6-319-05_S1_C1]
MFFPYRPDNPEGTTHQLQLFGGILVTGSFKPSGLFPPALQK